MDQNNTTEQAAAPAGTPAPRAMSRRRFASAGLGGAGALLTSLTELGVPHDHALRLQRRLQAGEFVVTIHGSAAELAQAHSLLAEPLAPTES